MAETENWASPEALAAKRKLNCQCEVVRLLNQAEALLTGWVLKEDQEKISELMNPLYELVDKD